jgi:hydroxymethylglutaryl-CoA lyase
MKSGVREVAIFTAASEAFNRKNLNCSVDESLAKFADVMAGAREHGVAVRGYVSCVVGCPYQGRVEPKAAARVAAALYEMGCYEVSMGDTIGVGTPANVAEMFTVRGRRAHSGRWCDAHISTWDLWIGRHSPFFRIKDLRDSLPHPLLQACMDHMPVEKLAAHMHDTYGQALANILASLQLGISVIDSSVAGLGGCPYAKGATGSAMRTCACRSCICWICLATWHWLLLTCHPSCGRCPQET